MSLKKAKTIAKAFLEPLPEGQDWYEKRLEICKTCPSNSANRTEPTLAEKLNITNLIKKGVCDEGNHCMACGCCIERKCATKSEVCGLAEIGEDPKWVALEVPSTINKGISLINLTPEIGEVKTEKASFSYTSNNVEENKLDIKFIIKKDSSTFTIKNYRPSCSCMSVNTMRRLETNSFEFDISISTVGFREGINERKLFVTYFDKGSNTSEIMITFKVYKLNGK
jgi:hypothetical protein